jgi:D-glycero-D-manno-heptose 1,7-bisphosphate phosphatase
LELVQSEGLRTDDDMIEVVDQSKLKFEGIRFVFLDRDGVINRKAAAGDYITSWEEMELLPGAARALARLRASLRKLIVVTNQRGIALGRLSEPDLLSIHEKLQCQLRSHGAELDAIYYCPHDLDGCDCRKPRTGMFKVAFRDFPEAKPENSVMIGDSDSDITAGIRMGMRTIRVGETMDDAQHAPLEPARPPGPCWKLLKSTCSDSFR